jgi:hypothetical protein
MNRNPTPATARYVFWTIGVMMVAYSFSLAWLSGDRPPGALPVPEDIAVYVAAGIGAGLAFIGLLFVSPARPYAARTVWVILATGLLMRAVLFPPGVFREDDHYRYMFDGAMVASWRDPYAASPSQLRRDAEAGAEVIGENGRTRADAINHPDLATIYPPVAQAAFAIAAAIAPWSEFGLRCVFLIVDLTSVGLLLQVLQRLALPPVNVAMFWWNPLTLSQVYGHLHMEVLLFPVMFAFVWAMLAGSRRTASFIAAIGVGIKIWPAALMTFVVFRRRPMSLETAACVAIFAVASALVLWPMLMHVTGPQSGAAAYASRWLWNDPLMSLLHSISIWAMGAAGATETWANGVFRVGLALLGGGAAAFVAWRGRNGQPANTVLWIVVLVFLAAPAKFPWYALWFTPLLALTPNLAAATFVAAFPIYYLRFLFQQQGQPQMFDAYVSWLQYVPFWGVLAAAVLQNWRATHARRT